MQNLLPPICFFHRTLGGFPLGSKTKETPKSSDPIGQEQNFGPKDTRVWVQGI